MRLLPDRPPLTDEQRRERNRANMWAVILAAAILALFFYTISVRVTVG